MKEPEPIKDLLYFERIVIEEYKRINGNLSNATLPEAKRVASEILSEAKDRFHAHQLNEVKELLTDLKRCGTFFLSAIEIDQYVTNPIDGEEFEKRINKAISDKTDNPSL